MTDRYNAIVVVLENDIRDDDAEPILDAIRMIKGVIRVTPNVSDIDNHIAYQKAEYHLRGRLWDALNSE
jgi:hypothetical protein